MAVRILRVWWTRTQRIRTLAAVPLEVSILEVEPPPAHQRMAAKVKHMRQLGMSRAEIARRLGVCRKTVAKALSFRQLADRA